MTALYLSKGREWPKDERLHEQEVCTQVARDLGLEERYVEGFVAGVDKGFLAAPHEAEYVDGYEDGKSVADVYF